MAATTLTICCLVSGDLVSKAFPVEVSSDKMVGTLKDAIKAKQTPAFNSITASDLVLWRVTIPVDADAADVDMKATEVDDNKRLLKGTETISKAFNDLVSDTIHVVVEKPQDVAAGKKRSFEELLAVQTATQKKMMTELEVQSATQKKMMTEFEVQSTTRMKMMTEFEEKLAEKFDKALQEMREDTKSELSFSRITQGQFVEVLAELNLKIFTKEFAAPQRTGQMAGQMTGQIKPLTWTQEKEDTRVDDYEKWLSENIRRPRGIVFFRASQASGLLNTGMASAKYFFKGTTDMALMPRANVSALNYAGGLQVGIELKKKVEAKDSMQAAVKLLSVSLSSSYRPVILLTDLNDSWLFFWLEPGKIVNCTFGLHQGVALIEAIAKEPLLDNPKVKDHPATSNTPYRKRCNFLEAIRGANLGSGMPPEESSSAQQVRKFRKTEAGAKELLGQDVADMRDVFDVMTEEEIEEWKRKYILNFVKNVPSLQMYTA